MPSLPPSNSSTFLSSRKRNPIVLSSHPNLSVSRAGGRVTTPDKTQCLLSPAQATRVRETSYYQTLFTVTVVHEVRESERQHNGKDYVDSRPGQAKWSWGWRVRSASAVLATPVGFIDSSNWAPSSGCETCLFSLVWFGF